jgi:AcrR family transcriptional regulator
VVVKRETIQKIPARQPVQARSRHKVQLILEAAMRLMDKGGMAALTTNAVAAMAGVSIGTLYQYFPHKEAILEALADQEVDALSARVLLILQDPADVTPQERIGRIVNAVVSSFGKRRRVHRLVMEYSLARGGQRIMPLVQQIIALLTSGNLPAAEKAMSAADAFVLTNAFTGVMRTMMIRTDESGPAQSEIEEALGRLIVNFVKPSAAAV